MTQDRELKITEALSKLILDTVCLKQNIILERISSEPLMGIEAWVQIGGQLDLFKDDRRYCSCCKEPWKDLYGSIWGVITNQGSKIVCDGCHAKIMGAAGVYSSEYMHCLSKDLEAAFRIIDGEIFREGSLTELEEIERVEFFIDRWRRELNHLRSLSDFKL